MKNWVIIGLICDLEVFPAMAGIIDFLSPDVGFGHGNCFDQWSVSGSVVQESSICSPPFLVSFEENISRLVCPLKK